MALTKSQLALDARLDRREGDDGDERAKRQKRSAGTAWPEDKTAVWVPGYSEHPDPKAPLPGKKGKLSPRSRRSTQHSTRWKASPTRNTDPPRGDDSLAMRHSFRNRRN